MRRLIGFLLTVVFICLAANQAQAERRGFFDPRPNFSLGTGWSYSPGDHDDHTKSTSAHRFHWVPFQAGIVLFNTERLQFAKFSLVSLAGDAHNKNDEEDGTLHGTMVFSPVLIKLFNWCWYDMQGMTDNDRSWGHRDGALTFDVGVDLEGRAVFSLGVSL